MEGLAKPNYKDVMIKKDGYNNDIIITLNKQFPDAVNQVKNVKISGADHYSKGRAIFNYLKYSVKYKKDPAGKQVIQLPARMINDTKSGDCKSKALAAAALMDVNGFKDVALRYASYDPNDKTPTHVYAVGKDDQGKEIIIDPVWKSYNTQAPYKHKKDYKMEISVISGVVEENRTGKTSSAVAVPKKGGNYAAKLNALLNKVRAGGILHNVIVNEMARAQGKTLMSNYSSDQVQRYKKFLLKVLSKSKTPSIKDVITKEIQVIDNGAFSGHIYLPASRQSIKGLEEEIGKISLKKIVKKLDPRKALQAAKAVTFLPIRKAFLLLVALNVRGLAKRLSKLSILGKKHFWVNQFGGKLSVLDGAIKRGLKKKPLFGASKKVKAIKGIGYVVDNSENIGAFDISKLGGAAGSAGAGAAALAAGSNPASGATLGTILAAAAPILAILTKLFKKEGVEDIPEAAGQPESTDFKDVTPEGETTLNKLETFVDKAADVATKLGVIPEAKEDANTGAVTKLTGAETSEEDVVDGNTGGRSLAPTLGNIPMPVLIGGAALVGFLLLKKKK